MIINLDEFRRKKNPPKVDFTLATDIAIEDWTYEVSHNKTVDSALARMFNVKKKDYTYDLNNLCELEQYVGLSQRVERFNEGWRTSFAAPVININGYDVAISIATPEMSRESFARAFGLFLFFFIQEEVKNKKVDGQINITTKE